MPDTEFILLIDDDSVTNYLHKSMIRDLNLGCDILTSENGKTGLEILEATLKKEQKPRLIIVDLNMPVMDGFEFMEKYKSLHYHEQFPGALAVLTTSTNPKDIAKIKELGIAQCLAKPLRKKDLLTLLES